MDYFDTGCMSGKAPRTKETLPDFCENMDPDKWEATVWYWVIPNPQEFCELTGCQRDPRILGVTAIVQGQKLSTVGDYPWLETVQ